jgi:hypothetical protein
VGTKARLNFFIVSVQGFADPRKIRTMPIIDDYATIAAELRGIQAERSSQDPAVPKPPPNLRPLLGPWHPMRATIAG